MKQELIDFLIRAKRNTYAAHGAEVLSSRPSSHDLRYEEGDYLYIDTYLGGECFIGEEGLWVNHLPVWSMNYSGRVVGEGFSGDFLKEALYRVPKEQPFRGPSIYKNGDFTYHCIIRGDTQWFQGYEEIFLSENKVMECYFHGGIVL